MSVHHGHRMRMIEKLRTDSLLDHECLEVLLFNGLPRKNTNELAHRLLSKFGTMDNVVRAPMDQVAEVEGVGMNIAGYIKLFGMIVQDFVERKNAPPEYKGLYDSKKFSQYLMEHFKEETFEIFEVYFLDEHRKVKSYYRFMGENNHTVMFKPEEFARALVSASPAGIVVAHNHPMGTCDPSVMDDENTRKCRRLCSMHNVMFCDHIVCGKNGCYSYYDNGKLKNDDDLI